MSESDVWRMLACGALSYGGFLTYRFWCLTKELAKEWSLRRQFEIRMAQVTQILGLREDTVADAVPAALNRFRLEFQRLEMKYGELKIKHQEVKDKADVATAENKKVMARALKRWQAAHRSEDLPQLGELLDWLQGNRPDLCERLKVLATLLRNATFDGIINTQDISIVAKTLEDISNYKRPVNGA